VATEALAEQVGRVERKEMCWRRYCG